jgi:ribosomal protein S18 acetylase RimI-like enzyme
MESRIFERQHLDGIVRLCKAEGWESYYDPERTLRALSGPGVVTVVAVENQAVMGFAQVLTDGAIRAYLANMAVVAEQRNRGIGRRLIEEVFTHLDAFYLDLLAAEDATPFYERFVNRRLPGYRLFSADQASAGK